MLLSIWTVRCQRILCTNFQGKTCHIVQKLLYLPKHKTSSPPPIYHRSNGVLPCNHKQSETNSLSRVNISVSAVRNSLKKIAHLCNFIYCYASSSFQTTFLGENLLKIS
jgi:hypothetical protein